MYKLAITIAAFTLVTGCASSMKSVPLHGDDAEFVRVAGTWSGQFQRDAEAVHGTIDMTFQLGRHTADTKVLLVGVSDNGQPIEIDVDYMRLQNRRLVGKMKSYIDPRCDCRVETSFEGDVSDETIIGTYRARMPATGKKISGTFVAKRID